MAKRSKRYVEASKLIDPKIRYSLAEATKLVKDTSTTKFDASIEIAFRTNLDSTKAEQNLRGAINLPHGSGKTQKILVLTKTKEAEAKKANADYVGNSEYIEKIQKENWFDFDVIVATPDMMGDLGKIGKILGPRGLMPTTKTGTVTTEIEKAVEEIKAGKVTYRVDKAGNIQVIVGKQSFSAEFLANNIKTVYQTMIRIKPTTVKGTYIKNVSIASSMGPGIKINPDTI